MVRYNTRERGKIQNAEERFSMALLEQWQQYAEEQQNGPKGMKFWEEYLSQEAEIYKRILESKPRKNTVQGYAE